MDNEQFATQLEHLAQLVRRHRVVDAEIDAVAESFQVSHGLVVSDMPTGEQRYKVAFSVWVNQAPDGSRLVVETS